MSFASTFFGYVLEGLLVGHAEEEDDDDDDDVDVVFSTLYLPIQLGETSIGALGIRFVQYLLFKNQKDATCLDGSFKIIFPRSFFFLGGGWSPGNRRGQKPPNGNHPAEGIMVVPVSLSL